MKRVSLGVGVVVVAVMLCLQVDTSAQKPATAKGYGTLRQAQGVPSQSRDEAGRVVLDKYCVTCHNE